MDIEYVENLEIDGVDRRDYPDFCDAFFCYGICSKTGRELTEDELIQLGEDYPEVVNEMAFECFMFN